MNNYLSLRGIKQGGGGKAGASAAYITITADKTSIKLRKIMGKRHYDEASVVRSLDKKKDVRVDSVNKTVEVVKNSTEVGNGSWGKIDYLHKVHGYLYVFVKKIAGKINYSATDNDSADVDTKTAKRERKLNMATMAKTAMRRAKSK